MSIDIYTFHYSHIHTIYNLSKIRKTHAQLRKITLTKSRVPNTGQLSSTCTFDVILSEN